MYWAKIKGRFRGGTNSGAERRIYLAIKYGNLWRTKVIIKKLQLEQRPELIKTNPHKIDQNAILQKLGILKGTKSAALNSQSSPTPSIQSVNNLDLQQLQIKERIAEITKELTHFKQ
jgi:hypothetical protein